MINPPLLVKVEPFTINSLKDDGFSCKISLPQFVYAPLEKGDKVGSVTYYNSGKIFATKDLTVDCYVKVQTKRLGCFDYVKQNLKFILVGIWES